MATTAVRIQDVTKAVLDLMEAKINRERANRNLSPLTKMQIIEIAILNLTVEMGIK